MKIRITNHMAGEGYDWPAGTIVETAEAKRLIDAGAAVPHVEEKEDKKVTRTKPLADETR